MRLTPGTPLGPYEVVAAIGAGGMGEVYRALDTRLDRVVALKILHARHDADTTQRDRIRREARTIAAINHPNICGIYDIGRTDDLDYLVMEHLEGQTLEARLRASQIPMASVVVYARHLMQALSAAHAKGVVHRDLKPANLFLTVEGTLKVLDFGIAKRADLDTSADAQTKEAAIPDVGVFVGTVGYSGPEQLRGGLVDHRTDLFAAGAVLYEMVTGKSAFRRSNTLQTMSAILHDDPAPLPSNVPLSLAACITRCLAKEPAQRFQSALEVLHVLDGPQIPAIPPPLVASTASIAVLPFADLSPDGDQEYFCDGMADELIAALMSLKGVRVAARSSSFQFKGRAHDVEEIGRRLKVGTLLEGSVRRIGNRLRVMVQLTDVHEGFTVWSQRYDRSFDDVFAVQDEIAQAVVDTLKLGMGQDVAPLAVRATPNIEAYTYYLKGRYLIFKLTPDALSQGMEQLQLAIDLQPDYAEAHASLAYGHLLWGLFSLAPPRQVMPLAKAAAERALQINPSLADGHLSLATVRLWYDWDWIGAEQAYRRAIELSPADGYARFNYAEWFNARGRFDEALAEADRAIDLDPVSPIIARARGDVLYCAGRFDEAIAHSRASIELEPTFFSAYWILGLSLVATGELAQAIEVFEAGRPHAYGDAPLESFLGYALALDGQRDRALEIARALEQRRASGYVAGSNIGLIHQGLGDLDEAIKWYRLAFADRSGECVSYLTGPHFAPAKRDPRFRELLARIESSSPE